MRETHFEIRQQGDVQMSGTTGYMVLGNEDAVCFYIDPIDRAYIDASSTDDDGCPVVFLVDNDSDEPTKIAFTEFPGWRFHCGAGGKSIAIALTREGAGR